MDFSKFKTPDWLKVGGAAVFLIAGLFLDWAKLKCSEYLRAVTKFSVTHFVG